MNSRQMLRSLGHMRFLRFGVRDRIIRRFHDPDHCHPEEFSVPFFGSQYTGNFATFVDWSVYYYGAYALEELRLIDDILKTRPSSVLLDIGANVGNHTLFAASHAQEVLAFEPWPAVARKLQEKIEANHLTNVRLLPFGLGEEDQIAEYAVPVGHNTGTGSFVAHDVDGDQISLRIRHGDAALAELGVSRVDFMKIDTEGYEPFVLRGLRQTLERQRPVVFFEWTQGERKLGKSCDPSLLPDDYRFYEFVGDTVVLGLFRRPTYYLRELADEWPDGSILAAPDEYVRRVMATQPKPVVVNRLLAN